MLIIHDNDVDNDDDGLPDKDDGEDDQGLPEIDSGSDPDLGFVHTLHVDPAV